MSKKTEPWSPATRYQGWDHNSLVSRILKLEAEIEQMSPLYNAVQEVAYRVANNEIDSRREQ